MQESKNRRSKNPSIPLGLPGLSCTEPRAAKGEACMGEMACAEGMVPVSVDQVRDRWVQTQLQRAYAAICNWTPATTFHGTFRPLA